MKATQDCLRSYSSYQVSPSSLKKSVYIGDCQDSFHFSCLWKLPQTLPRMHRLGHVGLKALLAALTDLLS